MKRPLALHFCLLGLALSLAGCAHDGRFRPRAARALVGVGTVVVVTGALVAVGCTGEGDGSVPGCSGDPSDANLAVGIPMMIAGASALTAGIVLRPQSSVGLFQRRPLPPPNMPDPFVPPLSPP